MKKVIVLILLFVFAPSQYMFSQEVEDDSQEQHQLLTDKFHFDVGWFYLSKNIKVGADGTTPNQNIDFGDSFKLNNEESAFLFKFDWRFSKKWNLSFETWSLSTSNVAVLEEDVEWQDVVFNAGTKVKAGVDLDLYRIFFGRVFSRGQQHEFGAGLGVHALNTGVFIEARVIVDGVEELSERSAVSAVIPLPNLGVWYYYTPSTKVALIARVDWFGIKIGDYSASLWNLAPGIRYQVFKNVGIGLDYRYLLIKASVDTNDWDGDFRMSFSGPLISINANF